MYYANSAPHMFVLPGRLRIHIRGLAGNQRLEDGIRERLSSHKGIRKVDANRYTGNVLVLFSEECITVPEIERLIGIAGQTADPVVPAADRKMTRRSAGPEEPEANLLRKLMPVVFWVSSIFFVAAGDYLAPLAILVVMDPNAGKLAARTALRLSSARVSSGGIAVNNPAALETAGHVDTVVFGHTGLLTAGPYKVSGVIPTESNSENRVLKLAASCVQDAGSPIGEALAVEAADRNINLKKVSAAAMSNQRGMSCLIDRKEVLVGSMKQLEEKIQFEGSHRMNEKTLRQLGQYPVFVAFDHRVIGAVGLRCTVGERNILAIEAMREAGIETVKLITEENEDLVRPVAFDAGIESFEADLPPEGKIRRMAALKEEGRIVAFVQDGRSECRPGQTANVTVAVSNPGCDPASLSGDFVISDGNLMRIPRLMELGKYTEEVMVQNRIISIGLDTTGIILVLTGMLTPYGTLLYKFMNSSIVFLNTLKIRRYKMIGRAGG